MKKIHARIVGTGSYLPEERISNAELVGRLARQGVETSDEWIAQRTGIRFRHFAAEGQNTSDLALQACLRALAAAQVKASDVDVIIVATTTPDMIFPSTAAVLQGKLGMAGCAAFDVQAVCTGFVYGLTLATALIENGTARTALVVGAEVMSRLLNFQDRSTCVLFGDGAGAVVLQAGSMPGVLSTALHADGSQAGILCAPASVAHGVLRGTPWLKMDGQAVFKLAVKALTEVAQEVLHKAHKTVAELDWFIPHQANVRIIQSTSKNLALPEGKAIVTVDQHGNTSAASIPLALDTAARQGKMLPGQTVLLEAVGGGLTWGAVLLLW